MMKFGTKAPALVVVVGGDSTEHRETRKGHVQNVDGCAGCVYCAMIINRKLPSISVTELPFVRRHYVFVGRACLCQR